MDNQQIVHDLVPLTNNNNEGSLENQHQMEVTIKNLQSQLKGKTNIEN